MKKGHSIITTKNTISSLIISLSLLGCTTKNPAQIEHKNNMVFTQQGTMKIVRVFPQDTVESIAQQHGVPVEILARVNQLGYPYDLLGTRQIMVPCDKYHLVKKSNETLKSIAKKYKVGLEQIEDLNPAISGSEILQLNTIVRIPKQGLQDRSSYEVMELEEVDLPVDDRVVEETHYDDSKTDESDNFDFEQNLQESQAIKSQATPQDNQLFKTSTPLNLPYFVWPLGGKVSRDKKDGITIYAPLDAPVKAAGNGKVIFAENDKGDYGNLVIIKHQDGYLSAYAHNNQMLVKKGEEVRKGQTISKVGKSGKASQTQLFFSMRKGDEIINPEKDTEQ